MLSFGPPIHYTYIHYISTYMSLLSVFTIFLRKLTSTKGPSIVLSDFGKTNRLIRVITLLQMIVSVE